MAAFPSLVQPANTVVTTTSAPASIAAALGSPSTAGTFLLMVVAIGSSAGGSSITTPAGWTLISTATSTSSTQRIVAIFVLPNNAGGISSVTVTISTTTGSAVATMFEISPTSVNPQADFTSPTSGTANGSNVPAPNQFPSPALVIGEIWLYAIAFIGASTYTPANTGDFSANVGGVATGATSNVTMVCFIAINKLNQSEQNGGTLTNTTTYAMMVARFNSGLFGAISYGPGGAVYVGSAPNPAGSLQVPQPSGYGNFYSGSTGG